MTEFHTTISIRHEAKDGDEALKQRAKLLQACELLDLEVFGAHTEEPARGVATGLTSTGRQER